MQFPVAADLLWSVRRAAGSAERPGPAAAGGRRALMAGTDEDAMSGQPVQRRTRSVAIGSVVIGGGAPIAIQSMTTTTPDQVGASVRQIAALAAAGCHLVRLAVPSPRAARALPALRRALADEGLAVPLVADVHFNPAVALLAAPHVEKLRINPGNFAATPRAARRPLSELIAALRERGAALRIGVNHGSLPDALTARLGHGPRALVRAAIDYLLLSQELGATALVVSIKASNPALMLEANRRLVRESPPAIADIPIHLGVTEAGLGRDAVLRSYAGLAPLLLEGIGETIRISLTGDPVAEIDACRRLLDAVPVVRRPRPRSAQRAAPGPARLALALPNASPPPETPSPTETEGNAIPVEVLLPARRGDPPESPTHADAAIAAWRHWLRAAGFSRAAQAPLGHTSELPDDRWPRLSPDHDRAAVELTTCLIEGAADGLIVPIDPGPRPDARQLAAAITADLGFADALLQATRRRLSRAEFISCPGCGRLRFDLEATVRRLQQRFGQFAGVKIAVMGCVVNGPGEMADADFGYVGAGPNRVDLYVGRRAVERGLTAREAERRLAERIRAHIETTGIEQRPASGR